MRVELREEAGDLVLLVQDDGRGIPAGREAASLGILGMRERAWLLGGTLTVSSTLGQGTTVAAHIPRRSGVAESADIP